MSKTTLLLISCLLLSFFSYPQKAGKNIRYIPESEVPVAVLEQQRKLFPSTFLSQWQVQQKKSKDTVNVRYIANLQKDGKSGFSSSYLSDGIPLFTAESINPDIIPENIKLKVKKTHPKFELEISNIIRLYYPEREIYLVKLRHDNSLQYVFYNTSGAEIKKRNLPLELLFLLE